MSSQVFPALAGVAFPVKRTPLWKTRKQVAISGKETAIADWSFPRWQWELSFNVLREAGTNRRLASIGGLAYSEYDQLSGFFNARQGGFDSFLYQDADDHAVTGQALGTGDGGTKSFQLVRSWGGFVEPVLAPNTVSAVYLNGVSQGSGWSVANWGSASPGLLTLTTAPGPGVAVTADLSFYWPVRFADDSLTFENFMAALYSGKSVKFISLK